MKYIIIGAVAGGASTAARLRRMDEKADIIIFEKGEYISYANCGLPYYIGNVIKDRNQLFVQTASSFNQRFNIDVRVMTEVTAIDPLQKIITAKNQITGEVYTESYDKLVLSPGAEPVRPPLPGILSEGIFTLRNVNDTDYIKSYIEEKQAKKAVVVGAGFIGLEMAENLHHLGLDITIIEMGNQILAPLDFPIAALVQQQIRSKGVDLRLNTRVAGFENENDELTVLLKNGEAIDADLVILSIGVRPDTKLATQAGLKIGAAKGIWVNEYLQTSNPSIYAVGDAIEFTNPITGQSMNTYLAGPANKQGRICANNIVLGNHQKYNGSINTAIVKVFDMTVATAGTASKHLVVANIEHIVSTTHSGSHAGYYPGSRQMSIQIAFSPIDGQLYSAQIAGYDGVDKRIDILSSIIQRKGTIEDLTEFEHAYAPPYSSAKDPVNMAGYAAENILKDRLKVFYWNEIAALDKNAVLVDVRTVKEFKTGHISNAISIPVDEIRDRLAEIPKDKNIYIYCAVGLRGYLAHRIVKQSGFEKVFNLSGGYFLWKACESEVKSLREKKSKEVV
jgi:NADPH-dependent 2,4-dienoyl-CoA reductase/sulfur reductase-like enzyme/rhodanese-related sulfurtransferase